MDPYVKNLGQVAAISFSSNPPVLTTILWYDLNTSTIMVYSPSVQSWIPLLNGLVGAENLDSEGEGLIFKEISDGVLDFRRIKAGSGISVSTESNNVTISLSDFLKGNPSPLILESSQGNTKILYISSSISWRLIVPSELTWVSFSSISGFGYSEITVETLSSNPGSTPRTRSILLNDPTGVLLDTEIAITQLGGETYVAKYVQGAVDLTCEQS